MDPDNFRKQALGRLAKATEPEPPKQVAEEPAEGADPEAPGTDPDTRVTGV